jgi:hypothetical protein
VSKRSLPITVPITQEEFTKLRQLQIKFRWDWPATFSANEHGHIWPYVTPGYTVEDNRLHVRGALDLLDYLADEYISIRPEGGRFFVDETGAYYSLFSRHIQFATFVFVEGAGVARRKAQKPLGPGRTAEQRDRHADGVCDEIRCPFCAAERLGLSPPKRP